MLKGKKITMVDVQTWDDLVVKTYGRPYRFQQQDGCKDRGVFGFAVPVRYVHDYENDAVPEVVNHPKMGVSFAAWLARDPKQRLEGSTNDWDTGLWWRRNFYPDVSMIINDLHKRGLLEAGEYAINIDW